jgi:hypothetical protein
MTTKKKGNSESATVMVRLAGGEWVPGSDEHLEKARKHAAAKKLAIDVRPLTEAEKAAKPRAISAVGV